MQVQVKTNVLAKNDAIAESLQQLFKEKNIFVFNLLGSPGAGKTSLLEATLHDLKKDYRLAVIEGEDKPLKYPLIFKESKAILINKIDLLPYVPFKKDKAIQDIRNLNPTGEIFEVSCTAHNGLEPWLTWLRAQLESNR